MAWRKNSVLCCDCQKTEPSVLLSIRYINFELNHRRIGKRRRAQSSQPLTTCQNPSRFRSQCENLISDLRNSASSDPNETLWTGFAVLTFRNGGTMMEDDLRDHCADNQPSTPNSSDVPS